MRMQLVMQNVIVEITQLPPDSDRKAIDEIGYKKAILEMKDHL